MIKIPIYPFPEKKEQDMKKLIKEMFNKKTSSPDFEKFMIENYRRMIFEHKEEVKKILEILSDPLNLPAIIHCNAGKDRTGWISFLLQSLLNVTEEAIIDDYLLTNRFTFKNKEIKKQRYKIGILTLGCFKFNKLQPILEARLEYLNFMMNQIKTEFGNTENYLINFCGLTSVTCRQIKANFKH